MTTKLQIFGATKLDCHLLEFSAWTSTTTFGLPVHRANPLIPPTGRNETLGRCASVYSIKQPTLTDQSGDALAALAQRSEFGGDGALKGVEIFEELVADAVLYEVAKPQGSQARGCAFA